MTRLRTWQRDQDIVKPGASCCLLFRFFAPDGPVAYSASFVRYISASTSKREIHPRLTTGACSFCARPHSLSETPNGDALPDAAGDRSRRSNCRWERVCRTWQRLWRNPRITPWVPPPPGHWHNTADSEPRPGGRNGNAKALPPLNSFTSACARRMKPHAAPPASNPVCGDPPAGTALSCRCS